MNVIETKLPGVLLLEPRVFRDARGHFLETYHLERYRNLGIDRPFVQDNFSQSQRNTLRGLHFQSPSPQGKLVYVVAGEIYDVAVDIRYGSQTFGQWLGLRLSSENYRQVYIPPGYAHGYCTISDSALVAYKCTAFYQPEAEGSVLWSDPDLGIDWPIQEPLLADKDRAAPRLQEIAPARLVFA